MLFILGTDTLTQTQGTTQRLFDPDTIDFTAYVGDFSFSLPWSLRLKTTGGAVIDTAGNTEFELVYCVCYDGTPPLLGLPFDFPLVLEGASQRFGVCSPYFSGDTVIVDLNPGCLDSVVFADIDTLVSMLNESKAVPSKPEREDYLLPSFFFKAAVSRLNGQKENRLSLVGPPFYSIQLITLDGNRELLTRLGYPAWLLQVPGYYDINHY